jgi:hypothetical protein
LVKQCKHGTGCEEASLRSPRVRSWIRSASDAISCRRFWNAICGRWVHDRCADPLQLEFVNGEATVSDDMVQPRVFTLDWRILESTDRAGPYLSIFTTRTMSAGAMVTSSETTGPIQVPILAGHFYAIGVALPADARYYLQQQAEKSLPLDVSFGRLTSVAVVQSASSSAAIGYPAPGDFLIAQGITTKL